MTRPFGAALFSIILCGAIASGAQSPAPAADISSRVDKLFEKWNRTDSPGCALSVMKDGGIVYKHAYGMANLDHNVTLTPSTVFHVASMSKQFAATSVVLLAQQGKLSLDDDVRKYVPELPDFGAPITLRHLIHHTSGLRDQWDLLELAGWRYSLDLITDEDVMSVVTRQKELNFKPGEKHLYCNTGYTLLAIIVKRVSGMSFREFTAKNIFDPLGMKSTHFRDDHAEVVKNNAYGYDQTKEGAPFRISITNFDTVGATSLHTTVEDLAQWDENFYHPRVGGAGFLEQMLQRGKLNNGEQLDYAFGLEYGKYKGLVTVDHGGADAGYRSDMTRFPEQHFSAAVLCNFADANPSGLARQVAELYLAQEMKTAAGEFPAATPPSSTAITLTEQQLSTLAGLYWSRDGDQYARVYTKDGRLRASMGGENNFALKPVSETLFHLADVGFGDAVNLRFVPATRDKPRQLLQSYMDEKPDVYELVAPFTPSASQLAEYSGAYLSEEIDPVYRFAVPGEKLILTRLKHKPDTLEPTERDVFSGDIGTVRFTRDSMRRISGFLLSTGRVRNFHFARRPD